MSKGNWKPPAWMYRDKKPPDDDAYFENMTRVVFIAGLNWKTIDRKWTDFRKAFHKFSIDQVAKFDEKKIQQLMNDASIVRNRAKITATINNARQFQSVREKYGSFHRYLNGLDESNNYASAMKDLGSKFSRIGPSSARIFLYSVGENIKRPTE